MSTQNSDGRYSETCGARNRNSEPCGLPAGWGTPGSGGTRCKFHGGASTGPKDTSHLEDNDFAKGNPGGRAPLRNSNAEIHGGWSDPDKVYDRLKGEQKAFVDDLTESYIEASKADLPKEEIKEKARRLSTYHLLWRKATVDSFERGWVLKEEIEHEGETYIKQKLNPALESEHRITSKDRKLMRELRTYPTSDGLPYPETVDSS